MTSARNQDATNQDIYTCSHLKSHAFGMLTCSTWLGTSSDSVSGARRPIYADEHISAAWEVPRWHLAYFLMFQTQKPHSL